VPVVQLSRVKSGCLRVPKSGAYVPPGVQPQFQKMSFLNAE
jgi:hypothetical protein